MAILEGNIQSLAQSLGLSLIELPIPVPPAPLLERAVGYQREHDARFLALWWEPCGDEVMVSDGRISFTGHWPGYLTYVQHPRIYSHLAAYNLGSSECQADYRLVIDLQERVVYILPAKHSDRLVSAQWEQGEEPPVPQIFTMEELEAVIQKIVEDWRPPTNAEVMIRMKEDYAAVQALRDWLGHPTSKAK